ncbi:hypothetical protein BJ508DRAFT_45003 [Ascobolus immersus RN42]|uniref:Uncharacterized protein n=1 Tax=Ascobolus immersus RN42 TaxID=1160509 RepID=A0A3N4HLQ6_ASCIM|nr:hypothetical protein BJ508DRAFT_45003 [Ascobolus immersus RN42]
MSYDSSEFSYDKGVARRNKLPATTTSGRPDPIVGSRSFLDVSETGLYPTELISSIQHIHSASDIVEIKISHHDERRRKSSTPTLETPQPGSASNSTLNFGPSICRRTRILRWKYSSYFETSPSLPMGIVVSLTEQFPVLAPRDGIGNHYEVVVMAQTRSAVGNRSSTICGRSRFAPGSEAGSGTTVRAHRTQH